MKALVKFRIFKHQKTLKNIERHQFSGATTDHLMFFLCFIENVGPKILVEDKILLLDQNMTTSALARGRGK